MEVFHQDAILLLQELVLMHEQVCICSTVSLSVCMCARDMSKSDTIAEQLLRWCDIV